MIGAFFDMDRTLLRSHSGALWIRHLRSKGEISRYEALRAYAWMVQYKLSLLDFDRMTRRVVARMAGDLESELLEKCQKWVQAEVLSEVVPKARAAIEGHRAQGHVLAILSSAARYVTEPLAKELGLDAVLCTHVEVEGGRFTGRVVQPVCYGEGKVQWAEEFAKARGIDLDRSYFYTDSYSDLPMLVRVGQRVVVNPDVRLKRYARRNGWTIEAWA